MCFAEGGGIVGSGEVDYLMYEAYHPDFEALHTVGPPTTHTHTSARFPTIHPTTPPLVMNRHTLGAKASQHALAYCRQYCPEQTPAYNVAADLRTQQLLPRTLRNAQSAAAQSRICGA